MLVQCEKTVSALSWVKLISQCGTYFATLNMIQWLFDVPVGSRGVADAGEEGVVGVHGEAGVGDLDTARLEKGRKFSELRCQVTSVKGERKEFMSDHTCEEVSFISV